MSRETKIQTVAALIAAIIALLRIFGITEFDNLTEDMISAIATAIVMVGTWAYASHWKNNDFTKEACEATGEMRAKKAEAKESSVGESFYNDTEEVLEGEDDEQ